MPHVRLLDCLAIGYVSPPASQTLQDSSLNHMRGVTASKVGTPDQDLGSSNDSLEAVDANTIRL